MGQADYEKALAYFDLIVEDSFAIEVHRSTWSTGGHYFNIDLGSVVGNKVTLLSNQNGIPIGVHGIAILGSSGSSGGFGTVDCSIINDGSLTVTSDVTTTYNYIYCMTDEIPVSVSSSKGCNYSIIDV